MAKANLFSALCCACLFYALPIAALEVGPDDFRLTNVGPDGDTSFFASRPQMVYNSTEDEYFVLFISRGIAGLAADEVELFGQRVGLDSSPLGAPVRISDVGGTGSGNASPARFQLVYNSVNNEYLVIYQAVDPQFSDTVATAYGRRVGADGQPIGSTFAVSESASGAGAFWPHVAYNATSNQYLVVWTDNEDTATFRINAQIMNAETLAVLRDDYVATATDAFSDRPNVAWDSVNNQYLVVWTNNVALFGQILDAAGDPQLGLDFAISSPSQGTQGTVLTFNPDDEEFLVVWGDSVASIGSELGNEELFGRRVAANGSLPDAAPARLTFSAGGGAAGLGANVDGAVGAEPGLAYSSGRNRYLITYSGTTLLDGFLQLEAFAMLIPGGETLDPVRNQVRISRMGGPGDDNSFRAIHAVAAVRSSSDDALSVWWGDDNRNAGVDDEFELYGQRVDFARILRDGFE